jgi:hypothetical protein
MSKTEREVKTKVDDVEKTFYVVKPNRTAQRTAQIEYNKVLREAVDSGAYLRKQLHKKLEDDGVWGKDHEEKQQKILDKISEKEDQIRSGGITKEKLKQLGIDLKKLRVEHRLLISDRNSEDQKTAEAQAENARFYSMIVSCVLDENRKPAFSSIDDYEQKGEEKWTLDCVEELANLLYNLDSSYEDNLVENRFLKKYKIVDENYYFLNEDGARVDHEGRLINEDGYFINEEGQRVNKKGRPVDENGDYLDANPILDDDGNPITFDEPVPEKKVTRKKTTKK